jgi:hypothetical protein
MEGLFLLRYGAPHPALGEELLIRGLAARPGAG